jgi:3-dehydroquinate synthase
MSIDRSFTVELGERSYPIYIGTDLIGDEMLLARHIGGSQVAVITNEIVRDIALEGLEAALHGINVRVDVLALEDGESRKNLATYAAIMDFLVEKKHNRTTTLIALGGGVVGDITGFAAATYQRGVNFIQVPTTLLAQVDSSVGGKTAVNHPSGKNLIGAFHQPVAVLADTGVLKTLPIRELRAGLAEVVKYGVIAEAAFFSRLEGHVDELLGLDGEVLTHAIARSCEIKAEIVAEDERETGKRALLNYGHTFGHAIESLTGYGELLHGEAVAIGMVMGADFGVRSGVLDADSGKKIKALVRRFGLPTVSPTLSENAFLEAMGMDKKVVDGALRVVVPSEVGRAFVTADVDVKTLRTTLGAGDSLCDG